MKTAIVIGVGPEDGLGSQLCQRFARGHHVFVAGRTAETLEKTVAAIKQAGGNAEAMVTDATQESQVVDLFKAAGPDLEVAIYNAGNNTPGTLADMTVEYFENSWRVCCLGGFIFGREAVKTMKAADGGTLLYTGASASLRGKAGFGAFNSSKSALRTLAQAFAKEYAPDNIHVGHVIVDGPIGGHKIKSRFPDRAAQLGEAGMISIQGIVDAYEFLHLQPANAWSFELDLRTSQERW
ncbi:MAG: SDR family NAD(P)-dependent oxidoreductase [Burkholderiaceae bacterium]